MRPGLGTTTLASLFPASPNEAHFLIQGDPPAPPEIIVAHLYAAWSSDITLVARLARWECDMTELHKPYKSAPPPENWSLHIYKHLLGCLTAPYSNLIWGILREKK